jgi:replicative DNA helicase
MPQGNRSFPQPGSHERAVLGRHGHDREAANVGHRNALSGGFYSTSHQKIFDAYLRTETPAIIKRSIDSLSEFASAARGS